MVLPYRLDKAAGELRAAGKAGTLEQLVAVPAHVYRVQVVPLVVRVGCLG
jgi:hypothetical protein